MARRRLRQDEARLWGLVASTVRPTRGPERLPPPDVEPPPEPPAASPPPPPRVRPRVSAEALGALAAGHGFQPTRPGRVRFVSVTPDPPPIEPNRRHRIARARDPIGARLDLHGLDQDRARSALHAFLRRAHADGLRAVLVITGKGRPADGVLKSRTPEWLADPAVRPLIAGVSPAERRHGGEGALYVALKRAG